MTLPHVFVETSFLFGIFHVPSKRRPDALSLKARFESREIKLYIPYVCFQEARHLIASSLPRHRYTDLLDYHRFALATGTVAWDFEEVEKLFHAATAEVNRTKAVYQRELSEFAAAIGAGVLHGTDELFDFFESLDLDDDTLKYNDKLILSSVLWKANELRHSGAERIFFMCLDKTHLQPTPDRPKMTNYYAQAGISFLPNFVLPENC